MRLQPGTWRVETYPSSTREKGKLVLLYGRCRPYAVELLAGLPLGSTTSRTSRRLGGLPRDVPSLRRHEGLGGIEGGRWRDGRTVVGVWAGGRVGES